MAEQLNDQEKALPLADGTVCGLAHLLAGTLRSEPQMTRRSALDLVQGLGIDPAATLADVEATLRTALGMPAREGLPDCDHCGQSLGITPDGLCASCAATAMLGTILHPEQALGLDGGLFRSIPFRTALLTGNFFGFSWAGEVRLVTVESVHVGTDGKPSGIWIRSLTAEEVAAMRADEEDYDDE